jgi:hypothetical protein
VSTVKSLYFSAAGISDFQEATIRETMTQPSVQAVVTCGAHTLSIGDVVASIDLGYASAHAAMVTNAVVKSIAYNRPTGLYSITLQDGLIRAVDNFLASDDPEHPFQANNISGEDLVRDLLANSGLTSYTADATGMTFATIQPAPINLISAWDAINNIAKDAGFTVYMDSSGVVHFSNRKPYIVGGDVSSKSLASGSNLMISDFIQNDDSLRNRVVVYGANSIHATASASSPYLPVGFYKSLVIAHELIDSQVQAQAAADLNLTMFNRLTSTINCTVLGDTGLRVRTIVDVTDAKSGLAADLFIINGSSHRLGPDGFSTELTLTR